MIPHIDIIVVRDGEMLRQSFNLPDITPAEAYQQWDMINPSFTWEWPDARNVQYSVRVYTTFSLSEAERSNIKSKTE